MEISRTLQDLLVQSEDSAPQDELLPSLASQNQHDNQCIRQRSADKLQRAGVDSLAIFQQELAPVAGSFTSRLFVLTNDRQLIPLLNVQKPSGYFTGV
jgi:hypothetical protein